MHKSAQTIFAGICTILPLLIYFIKAPTAGTAALVSNFQLSREGPHFFNFTWNVHRLTQLGVTHIKVIVETDLFSGVHEYTSANVAVGGVTVDELEPCTSYNVTVAATGKEVHFVYIMGLITTWPSEACTGTTPQSSLIQLSRVGLNSLQFEWDATHLRRLDAKYVAVYAVPFSFPGTKVYATAPVSSGEVTADGLLPDAPYKVTVEAMGNRVYFEYHMGLIRTQLPAIRKPTFEATYHEDIEILDILIHEPKVERGHFNGFEILMKTDNFDSPTGWRTVIHLPANLREYELDGVEPLKTYAVTVRGHVLPYSISEMADPLVLKTMDADLSVPKNVKLKAVDPYTVRMTWDRPEKSNGPITNYTVEWSLDHEWQENVNLSSVGVYDFTDLKPGQTVVVSICAHSRPSASMKFDYVGTRSAFERVTIPLQMKGMRKPTFEAIYHEDLRQLDIRVHEPKDVIGVFHGFDILLKVGLPDSPNKWRTMATLTGKQRKHQIEEFLPLLNYTVTVQGRISPDISSVKADPLIFEVLHADDSVPRNVTLTPISPFSVLMTWDSPARSNGLITAYVIEWFVDRMRKASIHPSSNHSHTFTGLSPGQTVSASISAHNKPTTLATFEYIGSPSSFETATTPLEGCMGKPTFEAIYYEDRRQLNIRVHKPKDVKGKFKGFEILMKIGLPNSPNAWKSKANLTHNQWEQHIAGFLPQLTYTVTVRGRVLPNCFSMKADPLIFEVIHAVTNMLILRCVDNSVPRNVELEPINSTAVRMTWSPPAQPNGQLTGYIIEWSIDGRREKSLNLSPRHSYVFNGLSPGQTISAAISARNEPETLVKFEYIGSLSNFLEVATPFLVQR
ncbi:Phosphotidylinositol phosphatase PTPRQ [Echinococcus multilocularis]|uniref:Phosphotidylinositol phosphatase PTPRQ n=1 Tax=Echinococcus multilocularis TaxID=6211 RepID=A0A068Y378_ECHMU|nr:Phosphotidylinositol phosphatase PTPRQ [Echinococcus multilocularis]